MRNTVSTEIAHFKDGTCTGRLNDALIKTLNECRDSSTNLYHFEQGSFSALNGLEYNQNSPVGKLMKIRPQVNISDGQLKVSFPDLLIPKQLKFPGDTFRCRIKVYISLFRLQDGKVSKVPVQQKIEITREKKFMPGKELLFEVPDGCLCLVSLFMEYAVPGKINWEPVNTRQFNQGCICGALITSGIY